MKTHFSPEVGRLQDRFHRLQAEVDNAFGPEPAFGGNDRSQIYKAILKSSIILDGALVAVATKLASDTFPEGGLAQVYPMLHSPQDTSEQGNSHETTTPLTAGCFGFPSLATSIPPCR